MTEFQASARMAPSAVAVFTPHQAPRYDRIIGCYGRPETGPLLVCFGGLHGNEPAGVVALRRVMSQLQEQRPIVRGHFRALAGNLEALEKGIRFEVEDLNRVWTAETVRELRTGSDGSRLRGEPREQFELLSLVEELLETAQRARREVYFLDLHTTSSESGPFAIIGDTLRNRTFARRFPLPIILGLEEQIDGTLLEYAGARGAVTVGFEAGQHESPNSIDRHEAVVWIGLVASGLLSASNCPRYDEHLQRLRLAAAGLPRFMEIRHRHAIAPGDGYRTLEGFLNFQEVRKDQVIGQDHRGPIRCPESGRLLMPLYQKQGTDGFFVARPLLSFWLMLSRLLRYLRLDRLLPSLPGVQKHPRLEDALIVNTRIARWGAAEMFHLLGYRKRHVEEGRIVLRRRKHDLRSPFRA